MVVFFFKQKTAYEMRISDGSSDVFSSDLIEDEHLMPNVRDRVGVRRAGEAVPVREVLLDLVERLGALAGVVLEAGQLVDDQRVEALEEARRLLRHDRKSVV